MMSSPQCLVARFGTLYVEFTDGPELHTVAKGFLEKVIVTLLSDPRIVSAGRDNREEEHLFLAPFWPKPPTKTVEVLDIPTEVSRTPHAYPPVHLEVRVPGKNQDLDGPNPPSEHYRALWDGTTLMVFWEQPLDRALDRGGTIVRQILEEAITRSGHVVHIQGPSMTHVSIVVESSPALERIEFIEIDNSRVRMLIPCDWKPSLLAEQAFLRCSEAARQYYRIVNEGERMSMLQWLAEGYCEYVLRLQHRAMPLSNPFRIEFWRRAWQSGGWRREARQVMASMLLTLAMHQRAKQNCHRLVEDYGEVESRESQMIFKHPIEHLMCDIRSVDLTFAERAVQHLAARLDLRAQTTVILVSGLLGAIIGAITTLIATGK